MPSDLGSASYADDEPRYIGVAIDHINGPGNEDFPSVAGIKETVAGTKGDFRLINCNDPFEGVSVRIDHRRGPGARQLLCQQPGVL